MQKDSISFFAAELPEHKGMQSLTNQVYLRDGKLKISILNLVYFYIYLNLFILYPLLRSSWTSLKNNPLVTLLCMNELKKEWHLIFY